MEQVTTNRARRNTATLIGLVLVALALIGSIDVGRTLTSRQFYHTKYVAELTFGLDGGARNALKGIGTGGQSPAFLMHQVLGASYTPANANVLATGGHNNFPTLSMRDIRES